MTPTRRLSRDGCGNWAGLPDARALDAAVAGAATPFPVRVGFSGCQNNCGTASLQDIGLVRMPDGKYEVYMGGRPGTQAPALGERLARGVPADELVPAVTALLQAYRATARGRERLWKCLDRVGAAPFQAALEVAKDEPESDRGRVKPPRRGSGGGSPPGGSSRSERRERRATEDG